jgi:hypothetical protein
MIHSNAKREAKRSGVRPDTRAHQKYCTVPPYVIEHVTQLLKLTRSILFTRSSLKRSEANALILPKSSADRDCLVESAVSANENSNEKPYLIRRQKFTLFYSDDFITCLS